MKTWLTFFLLLVTPLISLATPPPDDLARARAEIMPLFEAMQEAANEHDAEKHISYYARDPNLMFVINDQPIVGWDALLDQQRQWWQGGKTDVVYTVVGEPEFRMPAPGLVMVTYFLTSRRTLPDGTMRNTRFGISALWQWRAEEWKIIYAHESTVNQDAIEHGEESTNMKDESRLHHAIDYIEFGVTNMAESKRFYAAAFDWGFNDYGPTYAGIQRQGEDGEAGGFRLEPDVSPGGPLVILYSNDLERSLAAVREAGGEITQEPFEFPGGRRFHFKDPSGNELAVWSDK